MNIPKSRCRVLVLLALLSSLSLSGCLTQPPRSDLPVIVKKVADLTITLKPLSYDYLKERFGSNHPDWINPFIDYPGQFPQKRIVVFDTVLSSEVSTVMVNVRDITLRIGEKSGQAASVEFLSQLWKGYIQDTAFSDTIPETARRYMLPRKFTVRPGADMSGYLVFPAPFPQIGGKGILTIPVETKSGDFGKITMDIMFQSNKNGTHKVKTAENTGIFANSDS